MQPDRVPPGPTVDRETGQVTFRVDPDAGWRPVRVWFHLRDFGADPLFRPEGGHWVARIPRPPVDRLEYLLDITSDTGDRALVCDPANPVRVPGVFGDKSVVELPGYQPPGWLAAIPGSGGMDDLGSGAWLTVVGDEPAASGPELDLRRTRWPNPPRTGGARLAPGSGPRAGSTEDPPPPAPTAAGGATSPTATPGGTASPTATRRPTAAVSDRGERTARDAHADLAAAGELLAPADSTAEEPLPLLLVHDGPEYAQLAALLRYLVAIRRAEPDLRCRVLLLHPIDRDRSYSASPGYARALADGLLPDVRAAAATTGPVVGMGASLGGLAMLHVAVTHPGSLGAVFSQSGSFFRPETDTMERGYRFFGRVTDFVAALDPEAARLSGLRVGLTCGTGEDNLINNRLLQRRLTRARVATTLTENRDSHTYTGWRDALDPALTDLLREAWGQR